MYLRPRHLKREQFMFAIWICNSDMKRSYLTLVHVSATLKFLAPKHECAYAKKIDENVIWLCLIHVECKISWFVMWFYIVKPRFLFKTVKEFLQISAAFQDFWANSVKRSQTQLDLERMQVAKARHLCRTIGPLFPLIETCKLTLIDWANRSSNSYTTWHVYKLRIFFI